MKRATIRVAARALAAAGFSLIELIVVLVVISILLVVAISRLLSLQVDAERVAMDTVIGTMKSALGIKVAESIVTHDVRGLAMLQGANPMDRLSQLPANYLGELDNVDPRTLEDGNWYFDKHARTLVYLVRNKGFFTGGSADPPRAKFVIRLVYTDRDANGRYDPATETIEGVNLVALESYRWLKD